MVAQDCYLSYLGGRCRRGFWLKAALGKTKRPYQKQAKAQRPGDMAREVEHLPSKCTALSSIPSTAKKE
jgi:hypothetical protein